MLNRASLNPRSVVKSDLVMYAIVINFIRILIFTAAMRHALCVRVLSAEPWRQHVSEIQEST